MVGSFGWTSLDRNIPFFLAYLLPSGECTGRRIEWCFPATAEEWVDIRASPRDAAPNRISERLLAGARD
jgi:hypothetical protein